MKIASIIIAIVAGFLGLPAAVCAGACAAGLSAAGNASSSDSSSAGNVFMFFGVIAAILAIVGGIMTRKPGRKGPIVQAVALALALLTCITVNPMSFFVALLLLVSTVLGFMKKDQPAS
jgi:energy-converting hydrogenase Eha subunit B